MSRLPPELEAEMTVPTEKPIRQDGQAEREQLGARLEEMIAETRSPQALQSAGFAMNFTGRADVETDRRNDQPKKPHAAREYR